MNRRSLVGLRLARSLCASSAATLLAALITAPTPAQAAVSIVGGATVVTFDTLPAAADWSTGSVAGASADITTAAALDIAVAALLASGITAQLGNLGVTPPAATALGAFDSVALNIQTRPTGVKFNEVMATLQNNTGSAVSTLAISYNFGMNGTVPESAGLWGHRAYFSLTGLANSWSNITAFNLADNAQAQVLSGSLSLGNWASGATMFVLWADDNGPGAPDSGFTLDNVSFTPTLLGQNLIYNLGHAVGGAPNGAFKTGGGNYWLNGATPAAFANGDNVAFSQDGTATIDVPAAGVTAASMTVSHASGTYTIGGAGTITSTFAKSNAGSLVLTSANVFSTRSISGGSVETRANGALGTSGVLALSGGAILKTTTVAQTLGGQISTGTGGATVQTDTDLGATGLDGTGALTKTGSGALTLTGAAGTASGGLLIQAGKVSAVTDAVLGGNTQTVTLNSGTLEFTNTAVVTLIDATKTRTVNVGASGGTLAVTDAVQANGVVIALADKLVGAVGTTLTKAGAGTLRISAAQSTLNSNWVVSGGALEASVAGALGSGSVTLNPAGIVVVLGNPAQTNPNAIILAGGAIGTRSGDLAVYGGTVNVTAASNVNLKSNTTQANSQSITVSGKVSGSASLTLNGNNTGGNGGGNGVNKFLALTNTTNDYSGTFNVLNAQILRSAPATTGDTLGTGSVNLTGGFLQVRDDGAGSAGTITYNNNVTVGTGGGTVDVDRVGATNTGNTVLLGTLSIGAQTLTTAGANGYGVRFGATTLTGAATFDSTTATTTLGVVGGGFSLAKTGAGILILSASSNYTGGTTVNQGTLILNGANTGTGVIRGVATVNAGGTLQLASANALGYTAGVKVDTINVNGGLLDDVVNGDQGFNQTYNLTGGTMQSNGGTSIATASQWYAFGPGTAVNSLASAATSTIAGRIILRSDSGNTNTTFTVADGAALTDLLVSAAITKSDAQPQAVGITKAGAGVMQLTGANNYIGVTNIAQGTLSAASIVVSGGASNLGNATSAVVLGDATNKGTLSYTGSSDTYTRGFTVSAGGGEIDTTTSGQTLTIGTGGITSGADTSLTIGGAGNTTITAAVALGAPTGLLTKSGAGALNINSGAQTYATLTTTAGAGVTNVRTAIGTGTTKVNANSTMNFYASQTLAALNIADGVEVSFGTGLPFAGGGEKFGGPALVPEPGSAGLLLVGALGLLGRRRRSGPQG